MSNLTFQFPEKKGVEFFYTHPPGGEEEEGLVRRHKPFSNKNFPHYNPTRTTVGITIALRISLEDQDVWGGDGTLRQTPWRRQ